MSVVLLLLILMMMMSENMVLLLAIRVTTSALHEGRLNSLYYGIQTRRIVFEKKFSKLDLEVWFNSRAHNSSCIGRLCAQGYTLRQQKKY